MSWYRDPSVGRGPFRGSAAGQPGQLDAPLSSAVIGMSRRRAVKLAQGRGLPGVPQRERGAGSCGGVGMAILEYALGKGRH